MTPSTSTRPSMIIFSATRRDATPACDNTFCSRMPSSASAMSVPIHVERHCLLADSLRPAEPDETWLVPECFGDVVDDVDVGQQRREVGKVGQRRQPQPLKKHLGG